MTTALRFAMRCTPIASTTDRMAGSPSGTAATASETPSSSTMTKSVGSVMPSTTTIVIITTIAMTTTMGPSIWLMRLISCCERGGLLHRRVEHVGDRAHLGGHPGP